MLHARMSPSCASAGAASRNSATRFLLLVDQLADAVEQRLRAVAPADQRVVAALDRGDAGGGDPLDHRLVGALGRQVLLVAPQGLADDTAGAQVAPRAHLLVDERVQLLAQADGALGHGVPRAMVERAPAGAPQAGCRGAVGPSVRPLSSGPGGGGP